MSLTTDQVTGPAPRWGAGEWMGLRDLVVLLDAGERSRARLDLALGLAARHGARLTGIHLSIHPDFPFRGDDGLLIDVVGLFAKRSEAAADTAQAAFRDTADRAGVIAEWAVAQGDYRSVLGEVIARTRTADLTIAGQTAPTELDLSVQLVINAGRPVLFVPDEGTFDDVGSHVMVAWDSSREATRALNDALPLLHAADDVTVLTIARSHGEEDAVLLPDMQIAAHLSRHGIKATIRQSFVTSTEVGETIQSRAAETGVNLLVMGAYGHSRMRERILGGVTRHLLRNMTIPVLMSH